MTVIAQDRLDQLEAYKATLDENGKAICFLVSESVRLDLPGPEADLEKPASRAITARSRAILSGVRFCRNEGAGKTCRHFDTAGVRAVPTVTADKI